MFGLSGEHILVLLVILLIFGPKRLPDLGHSIGRTFKNFKDGMSSHHDAQEKLAERERLEAKSPPPAATPAPSATPTSVATPLADATMDSVATPEEINSDPSRGNKA